MARQNSSLHCLLKNDHLNNKEGAIAALNAILEAGYSDPAAQKKFRQAVITHKAIWNDPGRNIVMPDDPKFDDDTFLCSTGATFPDDRTNDAQNNFENLTSLSLLKRAELSLKDATESQLEDIIRHHSQTSGDRKAFRSVLVNEDGTTKFGSPTITIPNWVQVKNADFAEEDKGQYEILKTEAAKRSVSLHLNEFKKSQVLASLPILNAGEMGQFRQALLNLGVQNITLASLQDDTEFMNSVKKEVGVKFLILKVAELKETDIERLQDIAAASDVGVAKAELKKVPELKGAGDNAYIDLAVTEASLPHIREACALNALKIRISQCNDPATLDALLKVTTLATLEKVLTEKGSLGYADKPTFRKAFRENKAALNSIVAAAHIRKNLTLSDKPELLKKLIIAAPVDEFRKKYHEHFPVAAGVKDAINAHFDIEENVKLAREQALMAYVKAALPEMLTDPLDSLLRAKNADAVRQTIGILLDGNKADDLFLVQGLPLNDDLAINLMRYAAIEYVIREAKAEIDLSIKSGAKNYDLLLRKINEFTFADHAVQLRMDELPENGKERFNLQTHLAQSLIRNFPKKRLGAQAPNTDNMLVELAKAKDLDQFIHLLTDKFKVTDTTWVNKESMEQLQKTACIREIERSQDLIFGNKTHPQLFKLIENLPQEKRLALLDKPAVFRALAGASNKGEVEQILGGVRLDNGELINGLVNENQKLNLFAKITNYEIAATLAQIKPPIAINLEQVEAINKRLVSAQHQNTLFANDARNNKPTTRYEETIQLIAKKIMPNPTPALYDAFGLDQKGLVKGRPNPGEAVQNKINSIKAQQDYNAPLIERVRVGALGAKAVVASLLPFEKSKVLKETSFRKLGEDLEDSTSLADFHEIAKSAGYQAAFKSPLVQQLTPQIYDEIKKQARKNAMESTTKQTVKASLREQEGQFEGLQKKQSRVQLDADAKESLMRLSKASLMHSFNPAFQATALKNAKKMAPVISELSKQCESYIAYYANLKREAEQNATAIDDVYQKAKEDGNSSKMKQLFKTRNKWVNKYKEIESEYNSLRRLQTIFVGDPDNSNFVIQKGLLKLLEEAEAGSRDLKITTPSGIITYSTPYPLSDRARHFTDAYEGADNPNPTPDGAANLQLHSVNNEKSPYEIVDAIPADHFREHTVAIAKGNNSREPQEEARYLEERTSQHLVAETNAADELDYQPSLKYTATKVPTSKEGKVALAMSMAMQAVGALKEPPTAKNPIIIAGLNDPEFARYLWTALMVIGDSDPNFQFGKKALEMNAARVDIDKEFDFLGRWSDESIYNTAFKNSANAKNMLKPILALNEKRFGEDEKKEFKEIVEDTTKLRDFFKPKLEKPKVKKELDEVEANRPTLGPKSN